MPSLSRAGCLAACVLALWACGGDPTPSMDVDGGAEPPAASCEDDPCPEGERCLEEGGETRCLCPAGSERDGDGACTVIDECEPLTCDGRGTCSETADGIHCECDEGYAGPRCGECASGYARNHLGECVTDLCDPSPCGDPERPRCEVVDGGAVCECAAGTHDEGGECVPDRVCSPTTCSGRGTCVELEDDVACECDAGTAGRFCESCDEAAGYHDDGAGGCTDGVCVPNPCTGALETVCVEETDGTVRCECDPGAHREDGVCVPDEVCESDTCAPTGTCTVVAGRTTCTCDVGYAGERCDACAAGYHDDGAGGCTDRTDTTDVYPNGYVVLLHDVTVPAGSSTLDVDVPVARLSSPITVEGRPLLDDGTAHGGFQLYLYDRETRQRHRVADPHYSYVGSTVGYELRDPEVDATIPPGVYDLVYERGYWNGSDSNLPWVSRTDTTDVYPNGYTRVRSCVLVP